MGKVKHNLRHSNTLRPLQLVRKGTPDTKKSRRVCEGIKEKMIKKKPKSIGKKKRKSGWASDSRVDCEWCDRSFCR